MAVARADTPLLVTSNDELDMALRTELPVLLYIWHGDTLRSDVKTELEKVAKEQSGKMLVVKADAGRGPEIAQRYDIGKYPMLIGVVNCEQMSRRSRPWATDIGGMVESLTPYVPASKVPAAPKEEKKDKIIANNKPVKVTDDTFKKEVMDSPLPVLVDFWATWCGPCRQVAPILDKLAGEFAGKIKVAKVDVDENQGLAQTFRVMSIPTLMFVKNGKIVGQQAGALPEHVLRDAINQLIALKV